MLLAWARAWAAGSHTDLYELLGDLNSELPGCGWVQPVFSSLVMAAVGGGGQWCVQSGSRFIFLFPQIPIL